MNRAYQPPWSRFCIFEECVDPFELPEPLFARCTLSYAVAKKFGVYEHECLRIDDYFDVRHKSN